MQCAPLHYLYRVLKIDLIAIYHCNLQQLTSKLQLKFSERVAFRPNPLPTGRGQWPQKVTTVRSLNQPRLLPHGVLVRNTLCNNRAEQLHLSIIEKFNS